MPIDEHEKQDKGYVMFYDGQEYPIAKFDKMKLVALHGTDENAGGRPSATPITIIITGYGKPAQKTAKLLTLMLEIIGNEPMHLPLLFIHLSLDTSCHKTLHLFMRSKRNMTFQLAGISLLFSFASSPKGGMNKNIFRNWVLTQVLPSRQVLPLWPDLADLPGQRMFLKADSSGPRHMATDFLAETAVEGMYFFLGLPNATEIGQ
jgi:hypothetical protein